jgi:ketosteroid isomerase-like protein
MEIDAWVEAYRTAWEAGDADGVLELFTEDASYRSNPMRDPHQGHEGIRKYWQTATGTQEQTKVQMGAPISQGDHTAVEWWTTMIDDGEPVTLPGCLVLRFADDGRCVELREYWNIEMATHQPPPGWGS